MLDLSNCRIQSVNTVHIIISIPWLYRRLRFPACFKPPPGRLRLPACCISELRVPECNVPPRSRKVVETTVPSMQRRRPLFLKPRGTLFRREFFNPRERFLESQPPLGDVNVGQFWPVEPARAKHRRNGLRLGPACAQAVFQAAPTGSSRGLGAFELRWRAGTRSSPLPRVGPATSMATATSGPCAGGSRDILWRVSAAHCGARH